MKLSMKLRIVHFAWLLCALAVPASAHHGSSISYDTANQWTTWATIKQFNFMNPHPTMTFERTVEGGVVESWGSELLTNPSMLARQGWTKRRSEEALAPGTRVKLTLGTSRAGGFHAIVMAMESESGEPIAGGGRPSQAPDLDGVPGGLQPEGEIVLPGQDSQ
jgi:hypothetical protein